ncbi:MAG TPA: hypothetical protein PK006_00625 [Saprospiraceae bacterium]|nr:hypothetical protein [Saprospiraceae bacterium]
MLKQQYLMAFLLVLGQFWLMERADAQLNIQAAYGFSRIQSNSINQIIESYNHNNEWMASPMPQLKYAHGFTVGMRYSWEYFSLGASWRNSFASMRGEGIKPTTGLNYFMELGYKNQAYVLALETNAKYLELGTSIEFQKIKFTQLFTGITDKSPISNLSAFGSRFYLNINLPPGERVGITIQPFVSVLWSELNVSSLQNALTIYTPYKESGKINEIGVQFIFNNGPQE